MSLVETKMSKVKCQRLNVWQQSGFTLIELMVVVTVMILLTSAMVINLAGQRAGRDIKIAQNQLVSNLRKIQSYTLSARATPSGNYAQYYLMKFDLNKPNQYTIQAIYNVSSVPQYLENVETITLPFNIELAAVNASVNPAVYPVSISRPNLPAVQNYTTTYPPQHMNCALVAFAAPFGKVFLNDGCSQGGVVGNPSTIGSDSSSDDYKKILQFVNNIDCSGNYGTPPGCTLSTDSSMTITLTDTANTISKTVTVNAITGAIIFN